MPPRQQNKKTTRENTNALCYMYMYMYQHPAVVGVAPNFDTLTGARLLSCPRARIISKSSPPLRPRQKAPVVLPTHFTGTCSGASKGFNGASANAFAILVGDSGASVSVRSACMICRLASRLSASVIRTSSSTTISCCAFTARETRIGPVDVDGGRGGWGRTQRYCLKRFL